MSTDERNRAWVEVRAASLLRNYRRVRDAAGPGVRMLPMVKADGYGLGAVRVCRTLARESPVGFGVASVAAGHRLRDAGVRERIVVFTPLAPGEEEGAARGALEVVVGSIESLVRALNAGLRIHLEVDTGMGRAGIPFQALRDDAVRVRDLLSDGGRWAGVFTHLHSADVPGTPGVDDQVARFWEALDLLRPPDRVEIHLANSAASFLDLPDAPAVDLVRPGIHLYGGAGGDHLPAPDPVVSVRARIVRVAEVPAGSTLGYGATWTAEGPERWATLAIGYGDGIPRALSNRGRVLVHGASVPIVGRVSMDMVTANISALEGVRVGDVATLIGRDGDEEISIDEVAATAGTISYEILTGLSPRLPRIWEAEE